MNFAEHARTELDRIGEDPETIDGIVHVVKAFADCGHSGGSAPFALAYLEKLLRFQPLTPLTDDPAEWIDRTEVSGFPLWQSTRHSAAFSKDCGKTYWLVDEATGPNSLYTSQSTPGEPMTDSTPSGIPRTADGLLRWLCDHCERLQDKLLAVPKRVPDHERPHVSGHVANLYGLAHLLGTLRSLDPHTADRTSASLADAWDAGDSLGEWVYQWRQELTQGRPLTIPHTEERS